MRIKCEYCGNYLSDTEEKCPNCMAPNEHLRRVGNQVPQTIEELKNWYVEHNLPPEGVTRFFIGKDIQEPRAFGIYYDEKTGNYVVYKNKDSGERAIRYEGKDEAYAVNELYLKLKEEILHQKDLNHSQNFGRVAFKKPAATPHEKRRARIIVLILCLMAFFLSLNTLIPMLFITAVNNNYQQAGYYEYQNHPYYLYEACMKTNSAACEWYHYNPDSNEWSKGENVDLEEVKYVGSDWHQYLGINITKRLQDEDFFKEIHPPTPSTGYYKFGDKTYYYFHGWYLYNNDSWDKSSVPDHDVEINPDRYYDSSSSRQDIYSFKDTNYYEDYYSSSSSSSDNDSSWSSSSNDDSWDSGSSWDSNDSWDSGSTDWDSDW